MTINDLRNLDKNDVLAWLGLKQRTSTGAWLAGTLGLFAGGLLVGAGAALLMAPKPGRELREDLRTKIRRRANGSETGASETRDESEASRY